MAVKIAEACTYVLPPVLGFTTLGALHKYGRVHVTCFLIFFYCYNIFLVKCISCTSVTYEEMLVFRFFPHWVFSEEQIRLADPRLRKSCLALIPALVWTDPSSCVVMYFSLKIM